MSNLLDRASVVLTPTAYNNGEALCIKPSDGSGDFDFSRNSAATRVNAQGLVEDVQILSSNLVQNGDFSEQGVEEVSNGSFSQQGSELVTNGSFDTDSDWVKDSGWTIQNGKAVCDGVGVNSLQQSGVTTIGKTYKLTFDIIAKSSDDFLVISTNFGDTYVNGSSTSIGTNTFYITPTSGTGIRFRVANGTTLSIDNVSCVEVGQDWTFGTGWSVSEDKAVCDGTNNADITQVGSTVGKIYKATLSITENNVGRLNVYIGGAFAGQTTNGAIGDFTFYATATDTNLIRLRSNNSFNGSITNISVKEVGQNWALGSGWSIGDDKAKHIGGQSDIFQSFGTGYFNGKTISVTYTISDYVSGQVNFAVFNPASINGISRSTNGTFTEFISINTDGGQFGFRTSSSVDFIGSITNISVLEITDDTNLPRINYEGFSYQDALGSEKVLNGNFSDGLNNWTINTNALGYVSTSSETLQYLTGHGDYAEVKQLNNSVIGKKYKGQFEVISKGINATVFIQYGRSSIYSGDISNLDLGIHTFEVVSSHPDGFSISVRTNGVIEIDNVSVKEYLGQEVVPDSGCGSWLFEPQSTNLVTYSEDFGDSSWSKTAVTIDSDAIISPNGILNGDKVIEGSSGTVNRIWHPIASVTAQDYTYSIFAKAGERKSIQILFGGTAFSIETVSFDLENGVLGNVGAGVTASIVDYGNGWYKCIATATATTGSSDIIVYLEDALNNRSYTGNGVSGLYLYGAQQEAGMGTSYIPTSGTSVTRNQDVCTNGGSVSTINSTEGVLYAEIAALSDSLNYRFITISDGTYNNRIYLNYTNISNQISVSILVGGVQSYGVTHNLSSSIVYNKIALKWKLNDFALWVNGVEVSTNNSNITFSPNTLNKINFINELGVAFPFLGKTKALAVWKEALSDEELTLLTTI